jgi:hypothetical protein
MSGIEVERERDALSKKREMEKEFYAMHWLIFIHCIVRLGAISLILR